MSNVFANVTWKRSYVYQMTFPVIKVFATLWELKISSLFLVTKQKNIRKRNRATAPFVGRLCYAIEAENQPFLIQAVTKLPITFHINRTHVITRDHQKKEKFVNTIPHHILDKSILTNPYLTVLSHVMQRPITAQTQVQNACFRVAAFRVMITCLLIAMTDQKQTALLKVPPVRIRRVSLRFPNWPQNAPFPVLLVVRVKIHRQAVNLNLHQSGIFHVKSIAVGASEKSPA